MKLAIGITVGIVIGALILHKPPLHSMTQSSVTYINGPCTDTMVFMDTKIRTCLDSNYSLSDITNCPASALSDCSIVQCNADAGYYTIEWCKWVNQ